jgi:hypothetical protein
VAGLHDPPTHVEVRVDQDGQPTHVRLRRGSWSTVEIIRRWVVDADWWADHVQRDYWQLLVGDQVLVAVFRDRRLGEWFLERIYD